MIDFKGTRTAMAGKVQSGGLSVTPKDHADIGAFAPGHGKHADAIEAAMRSMLGQRPKVEPQKEDGLIGVPADVLRKALDEICSEPGVADAYEKAFGENAIGAVLQDLSDFRTGIETRDKSMASNPYASVAHLLYKRRSPSKKTEKVTESE